MDILTLWLSIMMLGLFNQIANSQTEVYVQSLREDPSKSFIFYKKKLVGTFQNAKDECKSLNGSLITVHTLRRQSDLKSLLAKSNFDQGR